MGDLTILRNSSLQILRANNRILRSTQGLYWTWEIDELIAQGWIPVATGVELDALRTTTSQTMGVGTIWQGTYTTGLDKKYIQVKAIDLSVFHTGFGWQPIGTTVTGFSGKYDGNNLSIERLLISRIVVSGTNNQQGLFGYLSDGSEIKNIRVLNASVTGFQNLSLLVAQTAIATNGILIENCFTHGAITGDDRIGGVCGASGAYQNTALSCDIINCRSILTVTTRVNAAGIIGSIGTGSIINCSAMVDITATGHQNAGIVASCYGAEIDNCFVNGTITGTYDIAGFVSWLGGGSISNSYSSVSVDCSLGGDNFAAGFVSRMLQNCTIQKSYCTGDVISSGVLGGRSGGFVAAMNATSCVVSNCYSHSNVTTTGQSRNGGFCGDRNNGDIINCYSTGLLIATGAGSGGFLGRLAGAGAITNCYWDKDTSGWDTSGAGLGRTTIQMKEGTKDSFILPAGGTDPDSLAANAMYTSWDDVDTWDFGTTSDYPVLK